MGDSSEGSSMDSSPVSSMLAMFFLPVETFNYTHHSRVYTGSFT
jgi:hypothetical protein